MAIAIEGALLSIETRPLGSYSAPSIRPTRIIPKIIYPPTLRDCVSGSTSPPEESGSELARWRRRGAIFLFLGVIALVFGATAGEEFSSNPIFAVDDLVVLVIAVVLIALWTTRLRGSSTLRQLETAANVTVVLLVVALAAKIFGALVERNSPDDFGDEIPAIYILLVAIGSRFV